MNLLSKFKKFVLLIVVLLIVIIYITHSSRQLKTQANLNRFYKNASKITMIGFSIEMGIDKEKKLELEAIQSQEGNLLPLVKNRFLFLPKKHYLDPFDPGQELPLYYGKAKHSSTSNPIHTNSDKPVWFTYSRGPSKKPVAMAVQKNKHVQVYQFSSAAYHPSNGLYSEGYLFTDSMGFSITR